MLQFTAEDALSKIYDDTIDFFIDRLYGIEPDLFKKLEVSEKSPGEYCNELVNEFRGNVTGQPVERVKNYTENLYYDLVYKLLKIRELHFEYYKRFDMDSDNERLANDFMAPLSILVTNIWRAGRMLHITELKEFGDVNIKTDFDLNGDYKPLFLYDEHAKKGLERQVVTTLPPSIPIPIPNIHTSNKTIGTDIPSLSEEPEVPPVVSFTTKLRNGFTEKDLDGLLVHMLVKNVKGKTLKFKKYIQHSIIDALIELKLYDAGNREIDQKALSRFLGLEETRIKSGYGKKETEARKKAIDYLKMERKKNGSNLVP